MAAGEQAPEENPKPETVPAPKPTISTLLGKNPEQFFW